MAKRNDGWIALTQFKAADVSAVYTHAFGKLGLHGHFNDGKPQPNRT